ncbi:MAG TPA: 2-oxoglutarate dehydrogenase complex dihydrolipoyllysine-residue succinyltransferase [Gemmataceae bacterium]|nr:2-oxoglutarate dehydrogenase complex dihydrolipoyllysine-residue succinyltransferase [Gemmataceae bacterium]
MPVEIKVPSVGESVTEGILSRWLKKDGEIVRADEPVVELETDKATQEVVAPADGRLKVGTPEGSTVQVGAVIGRIEEGAAAPAPAKQPAKAAESVAQPAATARAPALSPAARVAVETRGIDPSQLTGSGRGGRITKQDVLQHPATGNGAEREASFSREAPPSAPGPLGGASRLNESAAPRETRQRMSAVRQRIAARLVESQRATASLTTFNEIDLSAVMELRSRYRDKFKEKHGVGLGFMSFFVKAAVEALKAYPLVNARLDGGDIVFQNFFDVGVAVSTEKGLMVPIIRDCDRKGFGEIESEVAALAGKARDGKISVNDLQGGTFTITNGGVFGSLLSTPILNPPQTAILGMHAIQKRPVALDDQVVIRPMMYVALTYDHRLIDGREAVLFLVRIKECIENPERLLLEI